jgi:2-oxoisovalerate dehydrogenase E1 component
MADASSSGTCDPSYDLGRLPDFPTLTPQRLRLAYNEACLARMHVERVVVECQKGTVKFAIWGSGEEVFGTAAALALDEVADPSAFGVAAHYRSAALLATWCRLRGYEDFHLDHMRQQMSRVTDPWSGGRQMTAHFNDMRWNVIPVQSSLGMQVSKSVGYAYGFRRKGREDGLVVCIVGDGTMGEDDVHEGMTGASILQVPWLLIVTDNEIAISVSPEDGRGIRDFESYARAFGFEFFTCDGNDFVDSFDTVRRASEYCRRQQKPALLWVRRLSRLNDHSSAADFAFKFEDYDPLLDFGKALVDRGVLATGDIIRRVDGEGRDYFRRHDLGEVGRAADLEIQRTLDVSLAEPEPTIETVFDHIRAPFPAVEEPAEIGRPTVISLNGAVRAAMHQVLQANPMTWVYGQDVARKGGVMQATRGLWEKFPTQVRDAPINEPFIVGAAVGFALHEGATALPEIQFSDYSLNTLHWLVYLGNLLWTSNGTVSANVVLRLPVEPLHGGAVYHSMCMEGFYGSIPGLTICAPTTSRDFYGLLCTAAEYAGPVLFFESKGLYRMTLGDAFPGEPEDPKEIAALKRAIGFQGHIPVDVIPAGFRTPLGKAKVRQAGTDLTIVTWGRCTLFAGEAVRRLAEDGVSCELIDLRTVVPPDLECVAASVAKTGRLLVVHEDRVFASVGRELQGAIVERFGEQHVFTRVLGQEPVPGVPQNVHLEDFVVVSPDKVVRAARELLALRRPEAAATAAPATAVPPRRPAAVLPPVLWTPNRHFVA